MPCDDTIYLIINQLVNENDKYAVPTDLFQVQILTFAIQVANLLKMEKMKHENHV